MTDKKTDSADLSALRIDRDRDEVESGHGFKLRTILLPTAVILSLMAVWFAFSRSDSGSPALRFAAAKRVYPSQAEVSLTASGYVVAQRQAAIASKATGRLELLLVEEGDQVREGEIIAQLEDGDVAAALAQALANLKVAEATSLQDQADLKEAKLNFDRQRNLLARTLISESEFEIAEARFHSAEAGVSAGQAQIELANAGVLSAKVNLGNTRIRAPFDGTVLTKNADIGEMVAPFAASSNSRGAVVTIADMNSLEVEADVSESNIYKVQVGLRCEIILDAFPGVRYPGVVHKIVPTADRAKATVMTKVRFKERDEKVLPEMSAKVNFFTTSDQGESEVEPPFTAIPSTAVTERDGKSVVFVNRSGRLSAVAVSLGREFSGQVEIISGIAVGEQVVINPSEQVSSGMAVTVE